MTAKIITLSISTAVLSANLFAQIHFADFNFEDVDWELILCIENMDGNASAFQNDQIPGADGTYREVRHFIGPPPALLRVFHLHSDFVFTPQPNTAIAELDWSIDFRNLVSGQAVALAIEQNGSFYFGDVFVTTFWKNANVQFVNRTNLGVSPTKFINSATNLPGFPKLAEPVRLGFLTANSGQFGNPEKTVLYDNLSIELKIYGDLNCDGFVNLLDVDPFIDAISSGSFDIKADINQDGGVDLLDVAPFVDLLTGG